MCISRTIIKKPNTLISPSEATNSYTATKDMNLRKYLSVTNYDRGCFKRKLTVHSNNICARLSRQAPHNQQNDKETKKLWLCLSSTWT